jgi:hypothetical protein
MIRHSLERAYAFPGVRFAVATLLLQFGCLRPLLRIALESFLIAGWQNNPRFFNEDGAQSLPVESQMESMVSRKLRDFSLPIFLV